MMNLRQYLQKLIKDEAKAIVDQLLESKSLLIAFLLCLAGIIIYLQPFPDRHIYIGTSYPGSAWHRVGEVTAKYLDEHGLIAL